MKSLLNAVAILIFITTLGCNPREGNDRSHPSEIIDHTGCYLFVEGRDSIQMAIRQNGDSVDGTLEFAFYEKDKSRGVMKGRMKGDTLLANYEFTSEGVLSFRDVAFLKRGHAFVLGSGEIVNRGNRDVFKNPSTIEFSDKVVLKNVSCPD
jgi:hypothetical protein